MGSFKPSGGKLVEKFKVEDDDGNIYLAFKFELTIQSNEIHRDGMNRPSRKTTYFELEGGETLIVADAESETFKIVKGDKLVRKL